jgi:signal transduction histidine kinase
MTLSNNSHRLAASTNHHSVAAGAASNFLQSLGADLAFIHDIAGIYQSFYWCDAPDFDLCPDRLVGRSMGDTFGPRDFQDYQQHVAYLARTRQPDRFRCQFDYRGESIAFELTISPILTAKPTEPSVLVMGCQIADIAGNLDRTPELETQSLANGMRSLVRQSGSTVTRSSRLSVQVARNIRRTLELSTIWQQTVDGFGEAFQVSRCCICPYSPDDEKVEVVSEYRQDPWRSLRGEWFSLERDGLERAIATLEPEIETHEAKGEYQQQSQLVVATCYQGEPNALIILHQCDRPREWTPAELEAIVELADQVGTAIAHATLYKELEEARASAEALSRLKSEFLANTSHELRTPLNGMLGFLKLIVDGMAEGPEEQEEFLQEAYRSALHLLDVINDVLDIAKIEAGKMQLDLGPVSLKDLLDHVEDFTRAQVQQKDLYFQIQVPPTNDEILVYGNYQRLLQVMLNLVSNAVKFTHEGGVTISAEIIDRAVLWQKQELPGYLSIQVADTGIGVSLDKQDKLFQSFSQVDSSRTRQYGGTGLGLTISQKLVEAMGGIVNFYSMGEGLGSTVTFTVPLYQEPIMISSQSDDSIEDDFTIALDRGSEI